MRTVLVTGSSGFVGRWVVLSLHEAGFEVVGSIRDPSRTMPVELTRVVETGPIDRHTAWGEALCGADAVVHLASRAHVLRENEADPIEVYRRVNVEGSVALAQAAASAGVRRLVYVSSIGVNGNASCSAPFTETDQPSPQEPYAISKFEAETALWDVCGRRGVELVVVRPPLVYGPDAPGNFGRLVRLVAFGVPLPLGSVRNQRSLIGVWNLADFLVCCVEQPGAAGEVFLVADGEDLTTPEIVRELAGAMGRPARLVRFPVTILKLLTRMIGRRAAIDSLCGSLQVDASKARRQLNWRPRLDVRAGIRRTGAWYRDRGTSS